MPTEASLSPHSCVSLCDAARVHVTYVLIRNAWDLKATISFEFIYLELVKRRLSGNDAVFTARCYASAVLAMGLCLSVSVCHKSEFY